jgi:hypothetical protein
MDLKLEIRVTPGGSINETMEEPPGVLDGQLHLAFHEALEPLAEMSVVHCEPCDPSAQ